jgi:hypothetical protein
MNVLPEEILLELGIVRAWQGMETLERVALGMAYTVVVRLSGLEGTSLCASYAEDSCWRLWLQLTGMQCSAWFLLSSHLYLYMTGPPSGLNQASQCG